MAKVLDKFVVSDAIYDFLMLQDLEDVKVFFARFGIKPSSGTVVLANNGEVSATKATRANDSRLSNARTPLGHATTHKSGGPDSIRLDELAAPTDNVNLDASAAAHGLMPKADKIALDALVAASYPTPITVNAGVNLGSNNLVHIDGSGQGVKADAVLGLAAQGITKAAVGSGSPVTVYQIGSFNGFVGLTPGADYWLAANGLITSTPPTSPSTIMQHIGTASDAGVLALDISPELNLL